MKILDEEKGLVAEIIGEENLDCVKVVKDKINDNLDF